MIALRALRNYVREGLHILNQQRLEGPQRLVCESMLDHPPMGRVYIAVDLGVDTAVFACRSLDDAVPLRLLDIAVAIGVDLLDSIDRVE